MDIDFAALTEYQRYKLMASLIVPRPIALVTTLGANGVVNAAPFSMFNMVGEDPPLVMISINRLNDGRLKDTAANILRSNEFVVHMTDEPMAGIDTEILGRTRMVCVLPAGHELAEKASIAAADLQDETLISYRATSLQGRLLREAFGREGLVFQPEMEIDVSIIGLAFVQQGLGVAVVDGLLPWHSFPGLVTRPFLPEVSLPLWLLTSARRPLSRSHDLLRAHLRTACRELGLAAADVDHKPAL